jgi:thiol-disulfide isomerase/thioredoxin
MILFSLFVAFVSSEYIEITMKNVVKIIGGLRGVVVKFYSNYSVPCAELARDFSEVSTIFTDILFAGVDCPENEDICEHYEIQSFPAIHIFPPGNRDGFPYTGKPNIEELGTYLTNLSGIKPRPTPPPNLTDLDHRNWEAFVNTTLCGMVMFAPWSCPQCDHLTPQLSHLSSVYAADGNISVGIINCTRFKNYCSVAEVWTGDQYEEHLPVLMVLINGTFQNYTGPMLLASFVEEINRQCGTNRRTDGLLSDWAGTTPQADEVASEFMNATDKEPVIEKMKMIEGADYYVKIMQRYVEKGVPQLKKDVLGMKSNLDNRKLSMPALDAMKMKYNVFMRFLPTPTPRPISSRKLATAVPAPNVPAGDEDVGETSIL